MPVRHAFLCLALALAACSWSQPACPPPAKGDIVYVTGRGWHAELGIPVEELEGDTAFLGHVFPGARVVMVGYGKQTFVTAPPETISEYCLGPVPGPAVIHVVGLNVTPPSAYPPEDTITLALTPEGKHALSAFIWNDLAKDTSGKPTVVARSSNPDGLFYAARSRYTLLHTCNTWTAEALHAGGLSVASDGVIFSGQAMQRVHDAAEAQCPLLGSH